MQMSANPRSVHCFFIGYSFAERPGWRPAKSFLQATYLDHACKAQLIFGEPPHPQPRRTIARQIYPARI
jgi:hypothetical protein